MASFLSRDGPGEQSALTRAERVSSPRLGGWGDVLTDICSRSYSGSHPSFLSLISQKLFFLTPVTAWRCKEKESRVRIHAFKELLFAKKD